MDIPTIDGMAGFAALVNSLILWPVVNSLKAAVQYLKDDHEARLKALEAEKAEMAKKPRAKAKRRRGTI